MRGTFANIRLRNDDGRRRRRRRHAVYLPKGEFHAGEPVSIYDAADEAYQRERHAARRPRGQAEYGTGSSRDWAAKGTTLLGVRAVIAESFERIHRSNLVGMGVIPLQFAPGTDRKTLGLTGDETFTITGMADLKPRQTIAVDFTRGDGSTGSFDTVSRIDTAQELEYFYAGGILPYVLRKLAA